MNKLSSLNIVVAAALFGIAAENAWSEEAAPGEPAAPAEQTAAPEAASAPGTAPAPYQGGYERYWEPPPWPEPPPRYFNHPRPYYPPYPQYRAAAAAPAQNPLSVELKQTQEQLTAKAAELNTANEQLTTLQTEQQATREDLKQAQAQLAAKTTELNTAGEQLVTLEAEQQAIREVLQQTQSETAKAREQLSIIMEQMDILTNVLSGLQARLDVQDTSLLGALEAGEEDETAGSAVAGEAEPAQSPAVTSAQPGNAGGEQTEAGGKELIKPDAGQAN